VSVVGGGHGLVLEIGDHGDEDTPSLNFLTDSHKGIALSISDLDRLESGSHFFNLFFHFIDVHVVPLELHVFIESVLALLDMLPEFVHPVDFSLDSVDDLGAAVGFTLSEFEHFFIVDEFLEGFLVGFDLLLDLFDSFEGGFNSGVIVIEGFLFEAHLGFLHRVLELFDSFLGLNSLVALGDGDFLFDSGGNVGDGL